MKPRIQTTAHGRPAPRLRTASTSWRFSSLAGCTCTTWTERSCGRKISATKECGTSSVRERRPRCMAIASCSSGIIRASRSSRCSTNAHGDISGSSAIVWWTNRDTPYVPSPLLYDGMLYLLKTNSAILSVFDAKTGTPHYQLQRLTNLGEVFSSPVGAAGRVYITDRNGTTLVVRHGPKFEVLATNHLDDGFDASAALVDDEIYLRGNRYLYAIGAH